MKKLYFIIFVLALFFASCAKKGDVEIQNMDIYIKDCSVPYEVQFYLDFTYQPKEVSVTWDFGDGTTSNDQEPVHVYTKPGKYTAKVSIVNYKTVVDETIVVDVSGESMQIDANFNLESVHENYYAPCEIKFYNESQYSSEFFWDFGDGKGSDEDSPTHIYEQSGTYNVYLNAICDGDTVKSLYQIVIKTPPTKLYIDVVSIWLPQTYLGKVFDLYYYDDILSETPNDLPSAQANDFPFGWIIEEPLFFFNGDYDDDPLYFELWEVSNNQAPTYTFSIRFEELQEQFYPDTLWWDSGNGFSAEVLVSYGY